MYFRVQLSLSSLPVGPTRILADTLSLMPSLKDRSCVEHLDLLCYTSSNTVALLYTFLALHAHLDQTTLAHGNEVMDSRVASYTITGPLNLHPAVN